MVVSARHLHRRSLRDAGERDDAAARSPLGGTTRRRQSQPQSTGQSSSVLGALSDENSKLSRFLFIGAGGEETRSDDMPSMRMWDAAFMALALEPLEIRNERIIMLFEAYAIFGALLLNGVWIVYEWGSWKGYGGDGSNIVVERVFECIMAMAISGNVFLALWGAMYWVHSITTNSSHQDYVIDSIRPLVYLHYLLMALETLVLLGVLLGIYINLSPHWPETIVALSAALAVSVGGITTYCRHDMTCSPLEFYHFPTWLRYSNPHYGSRRERDALRDRAKQRAEELRSRAYRQRRKIDTTSETKCSSSIGTVLHEAAKNLGCEDCDTSAFEARLAEDWFNESIHLRGRSVESLSHYMPLRLAEEVHKLVQADSLG